MSEIRVVRWTARFLEGERGARGSPASARSRSRRSDPGISLRMWIRFIDVGGGRLGDREMLESPLPGDVVTLSLSPDSEEKSFKVSRRKWIPDVRSESVYGYPVTLIVLLEKL